MAGQLGDRDGRLLEMTRRRGLGRCKEVVRSAPKRRSARCCVTSPGVAGRFAKYWQVVKCQGQSCESGPGNGEEVMRRAALFLTSPRNNDSCYLLFEQPFSGNFHTTPCSSSARMGKYGQATLISMAVINLLAAQRAASPWFPSHDLLNSIHDALLMTHVLLPSLLSGTLITNASSSHTHDSEL